jgi:hypothetical protein
MKSKKEYIRIGASSEGLQLEVCSINWEGSHTPVSNWVVVKRFDKVIPDQERCYSIDSSVVALSAYELEKEISKVLKNSKYFQICGRCRTLNPVGHMHDDFMCQGCAERFGGIVY